MGYDASMSNPKVSDLIIQIAATVIATGIVTLIVQVAGVFRRLSSVESDVRDIKTVMGNHHDEFHNSHQLFEDGEYHHRRSGRV